MCDLQKDSDLVITNTNLCKGIERPNRRANSTFNGGKQYGNLPKMLYFSWRNYSTLPGY